MRFRPSSLDELTGLPNTRAAFALVFMFSTPGCLGDDDPGARTTGDQMETDTIGTDSDSTTFSGTTEIIEGSSSSDSGDMDSTSTGIDSTTTGSTGFETWSESTTGIEMGVCGDGVQDEDEACDDGNSIDEDGCSSQCEEEYCGDGVIQGALGEECDINDPDQSVACSEDCRVGMRVFITPEVYFGNEIGGLEAADTICNEAAKEMGFDGKFMAWLGTQKGTPATRMHFSDKPYLNWDGSIVALNGKDLLTCDENDICRQTGILPPQSYPHSYGTFWSNAQIDGTLPYPEFPQYGHCDEWSSSKWPNRGHMVRFGEDMIGSESAFWKNTSNECDLPEERLHLFCVEQPEF